MAAAAAPSEPEVKSGGVVAWIYKRFPVQEFVSDTLTGYYAPKNFNIWYFFGSLALVVLVLQLATGIFLTMFYKPGEASAFDSVEFIMREVQWGWLIRYLHSSGASIFFRRLDSQTRIGFGWSQWDGSACARAGARSWEKRTLRSARVLGKQRDVREFSRS